MINFELMLLFFLFIMIYITYFSYQRKQIQRYGLLFWMSLWILGIVAVIFHPFLNKILNPLNISRVFDLYTIIAFFVVLFVIFYLFKATQRLEGKIEQITRSIALKPLKEKDVDKGR